jgi:hypothetical protein
MFNISKGSGQVIHYISIGEQLDYTLTIKYYKKELSDGRIDANATIGKGLFEQAKNGNTAAAMFWLKTRAGWKETQKLEMTGEDGSPIVHRIEVSFGDD